MRTATTTYSPCTLCEIRLLPSAAHASNPPTLHACAPPLLSQTLSLSPHVNHPSIAFTAAPPCPAPALPTIGVLLQCWLRWAFNCDSCSSSNSIRGLPLQCSTQSINAMARVRARCCRQQLMHSFGRNNFEQTNSQSARRQQRHNAAVLCTGTRGCQHRQHGYKQPRPAAAETIVTRALALPAVSICPMHVLECCCTGC